MRLLLIFAALLSFNNAYAEANSIAMPGDNRLVVFPFDQNNTFTVLTIPDAVTDIQLMPDEKLSAMAVGDSVQWVIAKTDGHIFVKPIRPNIFTSATIVTDKRAYQLTLRSSPPGGKWFQRVSWTYPDVILYQQQLAADKAKSEEQEKKKLDEQKKAYDSVVVSSDQAGTPVPNFNSDYDIQGDASFRPKQVFDDGKFTWISLNPKAQEVPALFLKDENGKYELVNYIRVDGYLQVQRLFNSAVLKLGDQEVEITNRFNQSKPKKPSFVSGLVPGLK